MDFFFSVIVKMLESILIYEILFKLVFLRIVCVDFLYFDFYVFGIVKIFFIVYGGVGLLYMCIICSLNLLKVCVLLYK